MVRQGAHRLEQKAARWRRREGERAVEERCCGFQYRAEGAYPPVRAAGRNSRYAGMMLSNLGGSGSEMSAVALYSYDRLMTAELPEVSEVFRQVSLVERDHMDIFGELARQLGADPRLWCRQGGRPTWWTPGYLNYASSLEAMLRVALREERMAVRRYREQMESIHDENIVDNLERIIRDEEEHIKIFESLCETYGEAKRGGEQGTGGRIFSTK